MSDAASGTWSNWGGTASCTPSRLIVPQSVHELAADVYAAAQRGDTVKPVGSGHSFSEIAVAPGIQVSMAGFQGVRNIDLDAKRVTLGAGTNLHRIPKILDPMGLAMTNLGDIDRQTISGATSTGTHGTGGQFGGISTQIRGVTLVDGTGQVRTLGENDPELKAAALGLGALGIVTDITLQLVDAFAIEAIEAPGDTDETIDNFLENVATVDHYEFYWFPHTTKTLTKTNTRLPADTLASGPSKLRRYLDDELLSNDLLRLLCTIGAKAPSMVPAINQVTGRGLSARRYVDRSDKIFISDRDVRFREMEYALPVEAVPEALREVRSMINRRKHKVSFPIEVRAAAADDLMMSTASGRATGYIAVHRYHRDNVADSQRYFRDVEAIMTAHGGRPHWGKMHTRDAAYFETVYPKFNDFLAVRNEFDPNRTFANPYLTQTLGA